MRRLLSTILLCAVALGVSSAASGALLFFDGTLHVQLSENPDINIISNGTATVTTTGDQLNSLRLGQGPPGTVTALITDPNVPTVATLIHKGLYIRDRTLSPFSAPGPLTANTLPVPGNTKICLLLVGCSAWLDILHTENQTKGLGIGGIVTQNGFGAGLRISIVGAPWTVHTAGKLTNAFTTNAMIPPASRGTETRSWPVIRHGPASNTTSSAQTSGVIQLVGASYVSTTLMTPSNYLTLEGTQTIHFTPEPGLMLLLGSGVAGLALLGRSRMRR
jgi:hypothetical protein